MNLCLSAFVRVATSASFSPSSPSPFASAHSCGLRLYPFMRRSIVVGLCLSAFVRVATLRRSFHRLNSNFASAHSCGLRQQPQFHVGRIIGFASAHSCGLRPETSCSTPSYDALPQRIRAGCDARTATADTCRFSLPQRIRAGCDVRRCRCCIVDGLLCLSAFVRVATLPKTFRHPHRFLCLSAFVRVATFECTTGKVSFRFASAHSCGLRLEFNPLNDVDYTLCLSAFVRVATAEKQCSALRICCEKVDSFSSVGESGLALTIFPFSFAAKATYVAINDSFGRAIDRFFWCEPHRN